MKNVRGFTLLELLIVVVILAAIAAAALTVVEQSDDQTRVDITKARAQQIREAIVGRTAVVNGSPLVEGFVADMGRLPATIAELASPSIVNGNVYRLGAYSSSLPLTKADGSNLTRDANGTPYFVPVGGGWRGPYLLQESDPEYIQYLASFRDGWGNGPPDDLSSGWAFQFPGGGTTFLLPPFTSDAFAVPDKNRFVVKSLGSDGADDDLVTPPTWPAVDQRVELHQDDYLVRVSAWPVRIRFAETMTGKTVYLRLYYPRTPVPTIHGAAWDVSTTLTYVQSGFATVADSTTDTIFPTGFSYPKTVGATPPWPTNTGEVMVPLGVRSLAAFVYDNDPTKPEHDRFTDTPLVTTQDPATVAQVQVVLTPRSAPPAGTFFLTAAGP